MRSPEKRRSFLLGSGHSALRPVATQSGPRLALGTSPLVRRSRPYSRVRCPSPPPIPEALPPTEESSPPYVIRAGCRPIPGQLIRFEKPAQPLTEFSEVGHQHVNLGGESDFVFAACHAAVLAPRDPSIIGVGPDDQSWFSPTPGQRPPLVASEPLTGRRSATLGGSLMHSVVWRTLRLRPLRPVTRRVLRRYNRRQPRNQIAMSFGSEEARRQFEEALAEEKRRRN
jgi:hypothetical protein